jgi:pyrimidine deaminase RibD-like protein
VFSAFDEAMMRRALSLAEKGLFTTTPNPRVGCVITRGGRSSAKPAREGGGTPAVATGRPG